MSCFLIPMLTRRSFWAGSFRLSVHRHERRAPAHASEMILLPFFSANPDIVRLAVGHQTGSGAQGRPFFLHSLRIAFRDFRSFSFPHSASAANHKGLKPLRHDLSQPRRFAFRLTYLLFCDSINTYTSGMKKPALPALETSGQEETTRQLSIRTKGDREWVHQARRRGLR